MTSAGHMAMLSDKSSPSTWGLKFSAMSADTEISMVQHGTVSFIPELEYSFNGISWTKFIPGVTRVVIPSSESMFIRAGYGGRPSVNGKISEDPSNGWRFSGSGYSISGNIMSLLDGESGDASLSYGCFAGLFSGSGVVSAEHLELPSKTMATSCYSEMFRDCVDLAYAPELPADTLAEACYGRMFEGCTSLVSAPNLPSVNLVTGCYVRMFYGCSNLNLVSVSFPTWPQNSCVDWLRGVSSSGNFLCPVSLTYATGPNYIPTGWSVSHPDHDVTFTAEEPDLEVGMDGSSDTISLEYSIDGIHWNQFVPGTGTGSTGAIHVPNIGDKIHFRAGASGNTSLNDGHYSHTFTTSKRCSASGNVMALLDRDHAIYELNDQTQRSCFESLFYGSKITSSPRLPATTLSRGCYDGMFAACQYLTIAPELPALTVPGWSYEHMFEECISLRNAPLLPATTLGAWSYARMFFGCSSLSRIEVNMQDWHGDVESTYQWVGGGIADDGTFICPASLGTNETIVRDISHCPTGWNVINK